MHTLTISIQVSFQRPFWLTGMDTSQPSGLYRVNFEEEQLDTMLTVGWRQVGASLEIKNADKTEYYFVDPEELRAAIKRDKEPLCTPNQVGAPASRIRRTLHLPI